MSRNWTREQLEAINKSGTNIIVSAGAGSGKTAVLTERVISKMKSGIHINELLILTFTVSAAHEMKERIASYLKKDSNLKGELSLIETSYITTFDSYALSIVKKYGYLMNITPFVSICDTSILKGIKKSIIDNIFDKLYKSNDPSFLKLIGDFCVKDDESIKEYILKINDKLDMLYNKDTYLFNYINNSFDEFKINNDIKEFVSIIKNKCEQIKKIINNISHYVTSEYYDALYLSLEALLNAHTYDEYKNNLSIELPKLTKADDELAKSYRDEIKSIIEYLNNICVWDNESEVKASILSTKDYVKAIINIVSELDMRIKKYKSDNDLYEFSDIASISIKLIESNNEIRKEIRNSFKEILVDEYQDTNDLQEKFISLISNNNVYMVGDIKQSIYRFRNANPFIFKNKYELYKHNDGGIKIDLNKNFRSRSNVLNNINLIFDDIMDSNFGGADYKLEHRLDFGNTSFEDAGKTNQDQDLEIYNYKFDKELGFKKEEIEAFLIARDIKDKINNKYLVFDMKNNALRSVKYSDFCILIDRTTNFDLYKRVFTFLNIPLMVYKDEVVASSTDILAIKSLLKLILAIKNNDFSETFKYAFMSVGRSFLCDYTDDELFKLITSDTYKNTDLYIKASSISKLVDSLAIDEVLNKVIKEFRVYESIIKIGNINDMTFRIDYLIENAKSLSSIGYNLSTFIDYLEENLNDKSDVKIGVNKTDSDTVSIMTIHKSKGLEFNICYYSGLYAEFNISDLKELLYYDTTYGIITPYFNEGICKTIYKTLLREKYLKEEIEEKLRLFYVALTRCKEKMIMVADITDEISINTGTDELVPLSVRLDYRSFKDIVMSIKEKLNPYIKNIDIFNIVNIEYRTNIVTDYKKLIPISNVEIIKKHIDIESKEIKETSYSRKINELIDEETNEALKVGKNIHYYLEMLDFNNPDLSNINSFYQKKIASFLNQDILKDLDKSKIYKEYEFIYNDVDGEHHGIIDLMLEYDNFIKIVDYKLKDIDEEAYIKQLIGYQKYIESISKKRVELYLYSIMDEKYKQIS
jgi:ATP-dependent helicase/nuclease subunit A